MPLHFLEGELSHGREQLQPKKDLLHHMRLCGGGKPGGKAPSHNQRDQVLLPKKKQEKIEWDKTRKYKGSKNKVYRVFFNNEHGQM